MNYFTYRSKLQKQLWIYERYFPHSENNAQALKLMEEITRLKQEIKMLDSRPMSFAEEEVCFEAVFFESQINS